MDYAVRSKQCAMRSLYPTLFLAFILVASTANAQHTLWMNSSVPTGRDSAIQRTAHSAIKPYVDMDVIPADTARRIDADIRPSKPIIIPPRMNMQSVYSKGSPLYHYVAAARLDHTAEFAIRPIYDLCAGYDLKANRTLLTTAAGVAVAGDYGKRGYCFAQLPGFTRRAFPFCSGLGRSRSCKRQRIVFV
jgi:hypothetical protein